VSMKYLRRGWDAFSTFISIKVSNGSQIRFWHDIWCGNHPLNDSFAELFCIARDRDALVADHMFAHNDKMLWDVNFIGLVHDWKVESVSSFFNALYSIWRNREVGLLRSKHFISSSFKCFPWKSIWRSKAHLRVAFFTWTTSLGKILTMDNFCKRHIVVID
jgi:hypothetical protein